MKRALFIITIFIPAAFIFSWASAQTSVPSAPTGISGYYVSNGAYGPSVNIQWTDTSSDETSFKIFQRASGGSWPSSPAATYGANTVSVQIAAPATSGTYEYMVLACHESGCSAAPTTIFVTMSGESTPPPPPPPSNYTSPSAPSGLAAAVASNGNDVVLTWTDNSSDESEFKVYWRPQEGSWSYLTMTSSNSTSFTYYSHPAGTYNYKVEACNYYGCSPSNETSITKTGSTADTYPPSYPASLTATIMTSTRVDLVWSAATDNIGVVSYKIFRNSAFLTNATILTYSDTTASPNTSYNYYIKAVDAAGNESAPSTYAYVTTPSSTETPNTALAAVTGLTGYYVSNGAYGPSVNIQWTDNATAETEYRLFRRTSGGAWPSAANYTYGPNTVSVQIAALDTTGTYEYLVAACNSSACSSTPYTVFITNGSTSGTTPPPTTSTTTTSSTTTTTVNDTVPPAVVYFGSSTEYDGKLRAGVSFSESMNISTFTTSNIYIERVSDSTRLEGSLGTYGSNAMDFVTAAPASDNTDYRLVVKKSVKDIAGNQMTADYISASFRKTSSTMPPPNATTTMPAPPPPTNVTPGTVVGLVKDPGGNPLKDAWFHLFSTDFMQNYDGKTDSAGGFSSSVAPGQYFLEVFPPAGRTDLLRPANISVSVASGETKQVSAQFQTGSKTIAGRVSFSDGTAITDAEVGAYSSQSGSWVSAYADSAGNYSLKVSGGTWELGARPRDQAVAKWAAASSLAQITFTNDTTPETKSANITVSRSDTELTVEILDWEGRVVPGAGVSVSAGSAGTMTMANNTVPSQFRTSDSAGLSKFYLPAGRYYIRISPPDGKTFMPPDEMAIDLFAGEKKQVRLIFRAPSVSTTVPLSGITRLDAGTPTEAYVWVWSEKGQTFDLRSANNGTFSIRVSVNDRLHIGAGKMIDGVPYKSSEITVPVGETAVYAELILSRSETGPTTEAVSVVKSASEQIVVQTSDGAKVSVPPSAAQTGGTINVDMAPTVEAPSQPNAKIVSTVYDVSISSSGGGAITTLAQKIEIIIPYDKAGIADQGITEKNLVPSYFNEATNSWVPLDDFTIDEEQGVVIARVSHLTRFALVAAADITPPISPTSVTGTALGGGSIRLRWKNPVQDFDHAKVYRSTKAGELGKLAAGDIAGEEFVDQDIIDGTLYYYTLRAIDRAGNESSNLNQTSVKAVGTSVKKAAITPPPPAQAATTAAVALARDLKVGDSGTDVKVLQELLVKEKTYPEAVLSGFFGELTRAAVVRFQEKYASEILAPSGFVRGTGMAGPATRKKANQLLGASPASVSASTLPPGQATKASILRDLSAGATGDDVKALQQFLLDQGVYPAGLITGYFGDMTRAAVVRFQEKYAADILTPAGLVSGTGYFGPSSKRKMSEILGK